MSFRRTALLCLSLAALSALEPFEASAQRRRRRDPNAAAAPDPRIDAIRADLAANDEDSIRRGIETVGLIGTPAGLEPLAERIRRGLSPGLLDLAVETLTLMARPEAGPILLDLVTHRRPGVRLRAVQALVAARAPGAERALAYALSDEDPEVRSAAAQGLGQLGARSAVPTLFLALERGVAGAATSIGQLGAAEELTELFGLVGRLPLASLSPAITQILTRTDLPERTKLDAIARVSDLATPEVRAYLQEVQPLVASSPALTRAITDSIGRISE